MVPGRLGLVAVALACSPAAFGRRGMAARVDRRVDTTPDHPSPHSPVECPSTVKIKFKNVLCLGAFIFATTNDPLNV